MSDPFPKHRAYPGGVDLRGRDGTTPPSEKLDPLAELARLVGRDDPFKDLFPSRDAAPGTGRLFDKPRVPTPESFDRFAGLTPPPRLGSAAPDMFDDLDDAKAGPAEDDDAAFHAPLGQGQTLGFRLPTLRDQGQALDPADPEVEYGKDADDPPPLNADLWAQGMPEPVSGDPLRFVPPVEDAETTQASRRRTVVVLAAVLALTAGGLGATFLIRGGGTGVASSEPPTIMADAGPAKIQPPDTSNQATGGDGNTALIEKSASDNVNNAKVVDAQERPVDLAQLPKAAPAATAGQPDDGRVAVTTAPAGTNANPFPEPRKVKTVLIRPDGSVVGDAAGNAGSDQAPPVSSDPASIESMARAATPKSTTRATTTPKSTTTDGTAAVKPKVVHAAPKPKPVQAADATPDTTASTAPTAAGSFAVQLAAPPSEQEAKDVMARLQKKYAAELDGRSPSIRKADKGDKSVYRVRVGNLSQDDAKALCGKLQAGGGSCFVVHN